jgi:hypothetical protein
MAKRKARRRMSAAERTRKRAAPKRSAKRPTKKATPRPKARAASKTARSRRRPAAMKRGGSRKPARRVAAPRRAKTAATRPSSRTRQDTRKSQSMRKKTPRLDRVRRTLDETVPTPPSSLNMDRHGSAARTGRAEIAEHLLDHASMSPEITAGDVDVDVEDAYFTGDEAPGGDNSTPDQDVVDDIGKALGVQYDDNEELKSSDKIVERDKHRWEMDPASSEDYKDRK